MVRSRQFTREEKLALVEKCKAAVKRGEYPSFSQAAIAIGPKVGAGRTSLNFWADGKHLGVSTRNTISPEERREKVRLFRTGQYGTTIAEAWRALGCTSQQQLNNWVCGNNLGTLSTTGTPPPPSPHLSCQRTMTMRPAPNRPTVGAVATPSLRRRYSANYRCNGPQATSTATPCGSAYACSDVKRTKKPRLYRTVFIESRK